jgi:hypothetical protein
MAVTKVRQKIFARPRKTAIKKGKVKKGSLKAIEQSIKLMRKYNLDFSYLAPQPENP